METQTNSGERQTLVEGQRDVERQTYVERDGRTYVKINDRRIR